MKQRNTTTLRKEKEIRHGWFVLDAQGKTLGRFAAEIAKILRGKHRPDFTPHIDCGDGVIVINANKIRVTGSKRVQKVYRYYTGYMSGLREVPFDTMQGRHPDYIITHAVRGMMPKSRLARNQLKRLRVFAGTEHGMQAQSPVSVTM